ncbi:hypothetical protein RJ035_001506 [Blastomyces gilchristii]
MRTTVVDYRWCTITQTVWDTSEKTRSGWESDITQINKMRMMIRQSKIQAGPLFLGYGFLSSLVKLSLILVSSVTYKALVKGTAVIVSIDYMVLAGLLLWRGIRGIPFAIHAILVIITAGFAAGGLVHDWPLWIEAMLIITICVYMARPGNTLADLGQLSLYQESRSAHLPFIPGRTMAATSMTEESYTQLDEVRTARPESAHLSNSNFQKIRAVTSIYYPNRPELKTGVFTVLCEGCQGNYQRELRYNELADYSNWEDALRSFGYGQRFDLKPAITQESKYPSDERKCTTQQKNLQLS